MAKLSSMIQFHMQSWTEAADGNDECPEHYSGTCYSVEGPIPFAEFPQFPRGCGSRIVLAPYRLDALRGFRYDFEIPKMRLEQFKFASLVMHELSHAIYNAVIGKRWPEVFCGSSLLSEQGFEMERALFGGLVSDHWYDSPDSEHETYSGEAFWAVEIWPSPHRASLYRFSDDALCWRV